MSKARLLYVAYDDDDHKLAQELERHMAPLERQGLLQVWSERHIAAGMSSADEVSKHLDSADIILLLVSASFLASSHCVLLTQRALARYQSGLAHVIPIVLRPCLWDDTGFGNIAPLPDNKMPVTSWRDPDAAWLNVVLGIRSVMNKRNEQQPGAPDPPPRPRSRPHSSVFLAMSESTRDRQGHPTHRASGDGDGVALFAWIHISDLHFGHGDASHGWDQQLVTAALRKDVSAIIDTGVPVPDAILVTGDIAFSGDTRTRPDGLPSQEYADARDFLLHLGQASGVDTRQIYVVPGNHDVQRSADQNRNTRRLLSELRSGGESLDAVMAHAEDRAQLAQRQANYLRFAAGFAPACLGEAVPDSDRLWWHHSHEARGGLTVRLIGFNTALLAANDQDRGKLRLGKAMLAQAFSLPRRADELRVVLTHHPFWGNWLADQQDSERWVRSNADIHLYGHIHEAESEEARSGAGNSFVRVAAGAAHASAPPLSVSKGHGYNLAAVMAMPDGLRKLRIWPRQWSDKNKDFRADTDNLPDGRFFAEHPLRLRKSSG